MSPAPTLHTPRLTLTGHHPDDLEDLAAMWAEPAVYAMIGGAARSREDVWLRLLRSVGQWTAFGYGSWVARETATGRLVGEVGLLEARRAIVPPIDADPEAGWALTGWAQRQGFASEALAAALDWVDAHGIDRTVCIIDPPNVTSIRLAERLGYAPVRQAAYDGETVIVFLRDAGSAGTAGPTAPDPLHSPM